MIARRLVLVSLATFGWLVCGVTVAAHPVPFSYMDVRLAPTARDITIVLHSYDVAHDLEVAPMERLLNPEVARAQMAAVAVPVHALGWSLFSFNLGVEAGQLVIVVPVAGSVTVILAGSYGFIQRIVYTGGL
ncbi:MAG: hypothetical protein EXQ49_01335 [Acidobacteria bacterium]|nr:hypothetical protein [Acidobacteriota bacterium]